MGTGGAGIARGPGAMLPCMSRLIPKPGGQGGSGGGDAGVLRACGDVPPDLDHDVPLAKRGDQRGGGCSSVPLAWPKLLLDDAGLALGDAVPFS